MPRAVLFDLDDTLLGNSMSTFIPAYFEALTRWASGRVEPRRLVGALLAATAAMDANDGAGPTNEDAFAAVFYPMVGIDREELEPVFERFYEEAFPALRALTRPLPEAPRLVGAALEAGLQVAVATNPLFPLTAIEQRLEWGGVGPGAFRYDVVTSYETCHATKPRAAYYREILGRLGREPGECLMVGDSWELDIAPAVALGMAAYLVAPLPALRHRSAAGLTGHGPLAELWRRVREAGGRFPGGGAG